MDDRSGTPRLRCATCGKGFSPHRAAKKTQRTCPGNCRRDRRGKRAKQRRSLKPEHHRRLERARQRKRRSLAREREQGGAVERVTAAVSRAGLSVEVSQMVQLALEVWDVQARVSRARLEAELTRHVRFSGPNLAGA
jgi:ribosomal 50S subunit-recycling heat shock protein